MPDLDPNDDQATRYLLGELSGQDKLDFEARLASSPALRATLQELEAACDALALTAPARRPSRSVWKAIDREVHNRPRAHALANARAHLERLWREWFWKAGWGVATGMVLLWALRSPSPSTDPKSKVAASDIATGTPNDSATSSRASSPTRSTTLPIPFRPVAISPGTANPSSQLAREDSQRLERAIRELNDLNRTLTQHLVLPPGAARFQVFRLTPTNATAPRISSDASLLAHSEVESDSNNDITALEETLARALAQQLASNPSGRGFAQNSSAPVNPTTKSPNAGSSPPSLTSSEGSTPVVTANSDSPTSVASVTGNPAASDVDAPTTIASVGRTPVGDASLNADSVDSAITPPGNGSESFEVVDLTAGQSFANNTSTPLTPNRSAVADKSAVSDVTADIPSQSTALGTFSSETGAGTIALISSDAPAPGLVYQFWAYDTQNFNSVSLGTSASTGGRLLIRFTLDPKTFVNPGFLITLEQVSGSPVPSGPIVVGPPGVTFPGLTPAP